MIVHGDRGRGAEHLLEKARDHPTSNGRELISRVPDTITTGTTPGGHICGANEEGVILRGGDIGVIR